MRRNDNIVPFRNLHSLAQTWQGEGYFCGFLACMTVNVPSGSERSRQGGPRSAFGSHVFHDDARDDIGGFIAPVGGIAEMAIYLAHLQHVNSVRSLEQVS